VPNFRRQINPRALNSFTGGDLRAKFLLLTLFPVFYALDQNGGLISLGFSRGMTMEKQFKIRPDYATGRVFAAERYDVPTFRKLQ